MKAAQKIIFPCDYGVELLSELPGNTSGHNVLYYPGAVESGGNDGIMVKVSPADGQSWIGIFAFGFPEDEYSEANGIYSCPNRHSLCVVADGDAFIVDTKSPKQWTIVHCTPVLQVHSMLEHGLLLFQDFSTICAWSSDGHFWSANVAHDGIKIEGSNETSVFGRALGPVPGKENVPFEIDLKTGKVTGGNSI
jgi:hypothetical protein